MAVPMSIPTFSPSTNSIALIAVGVFSLLVARRWARPSKLKTPPGPKPKPLIGNVLDIPAAGKQESTYLQWSKDYDSKLVSMSFFGMTLIVVNTYDAAVELFDHRGINYSGRPYIPMITELLGQTWMTTFLQYTPKWKAHRRFFHQTFGATAVKQFHKQQQQTSLTMLNSLLEDPAEYRELLKHMTSALAVSVTYGAEVLPKHDPLVEKLDTMIQHNLDAFTPGNFMVKDLPFLRHVPEWFPGGGFQKTLREWKILSDEIVLEPFLVAKDDFATGKATESFVSVNLRLIDHNVKESVQEQEDLIKDAAATMYSAAADTTFTTILYCILALTWHPEIQAKAQAELDAVLHGRVPTFEDRDSLSIVDAIVKETMRYFTLLPLSVPHATTEEDHYDGYRIPAGSLVMGNAWAILHDEKAYPEPNTYKPERFLTGDGKLNTDVRDPTMAFGFGRRICPGRHLATEFVWLTVAGILSQFNITQCLDIEGNPIRPDGKCSPGLLAIPDPFPCDIRPRSANAELTLKQSLSNLML